MAKILTVQFHIEADTKAHLPKPNLFFLKAPCDVSRCTPDSIAGMYTDHRLLWKALL